MASITPFGRMSTVAMIVALAVTAAGCSGEEGNEDARDDGDAAQEPRQDVSETLEMPEGEDAADGQAEEVQEEELPCPSFSEVQPIFTGSCTSCHPGRDSYAYLTSNLDTVRRYVEGFHHIGGDDRTTALRWIDCGAPE